MNLSHETPNAVAPPRFAQPPVVETALGIQFDELGSMTASHLGLYFNQVRSRYPIAKDQPRLASITELFPARPVMPDLKFQLVNSKPVERVWFMSNGEGDDPGDKLIQIQPDRFGFNWRKPGEDSAYPSYSRNGRECLEEFGRFAEFCRQENLGVLKPNLCEVVYVNHIVPPDGCSAIDDFGIVFPGVSWESGTGWLPTPERASLNRVYVIGENQGRLYAEASIGTVRGQGDIIVLKMVGRVICNDSVRVAEGLQLAHDWVVKGFECLTAPAVRRERWGQSA